MSDLIKRESAIVALANNRCGNDEWDLAVTHDVETIKKLPLVEPSPRWIPCTERMPEDAYGCIVTVMDTNPMTCDEFENLYPDFVGYDGETWNNADGEPIPYEVIAWMPLPKPYKAESEDKE